MKGFLYFAAGVLTLVVAGVLLWWVLGGAPHMFLPGIPSDGTQYTTSKPGWGAKSRTSISCDDKQQGTPFKCGDASPTGECICP